MLLFKRILAFGKDETPSDRRLGLRYCISPRFPLKAVLNLVRRDDEGHLLPSSDGQGRDWSGRLINISRSGARIQLPRAICVQPGDRCRLKLDLEGHPLELPGCIAHVIERRDSVVYGLVLDTVEADGRAAYDQFIELIALGATLKPSRPAQPHNEHYLIEQYEGEPGAGARLDIWRRTDDRDVAAFEFWLRDYRVRGLAGRSMLEYLPASEADSACPMPPEQSAEVHRLFHWVVPNLQTAVAADVREFLRNYAA